MENDSLLTMLYKGFSRGESVSPADLVSALDGETLSSSTKFKIKRLVSDAAEIDPDICSKAFVYYIGEGLFNDASKKNNLKEFNEYIYSTLLKLNSNIISAQTHSFMNMYIKGCSLMNSTPFYNEWLMQTNKKHEI